MRAFRMILVCVVALAACAPVTAPHGTPTSLARGALLISVDGLRPDLILQADAPHLRELMARGSFSLWAETVPVAITLPSHTSMLTGVPVEVHGVTWNGDPPNSTPWPASPTLFAVARKAGYRTAMATGKSKFAALAVPGTLDRSYVPTSRKITDAVVADTASRWIEQDAAQVMFVHLPSVDTAGHTYGWGSRQQLAAIAEADRCIGRLLDALQRKNRLESTVVLVTSDHGGSGRSHGRDVALSLHIPWIIAGPGVRAGHDLHQAADVAIRTEDTFATLCTRLGIAVDTTIAGRPVEVGITSASAPPAAEAAADH